MIAFRRLSHAPKITTSRIVLVGLGSSYPGGYHCRTWLEDIDADGKVEICRYNRRASLECLRWAAAGGARGRLDEALKLVLKSTSPYVDRKALAELLSARPAGQALPAGAGRRLSGAPNPYTQC